MSNRDKEKFLEAVKEGHLDKVKEMLSKPGFNVNVKNKTCADCVNCNHF